MNSNADQRTNDLQAQLEALLPIANCGAFRVVLDAAGQLAEPTLPGSWIAVSPTLLGLPAEVPVTFDRVLSLFASDIGSASGHIAQAIASGSPEPITHVVSRTGPAGRKIWLESRITVVRDARGHPLHLDGTLRDVAQERHGQGDVRAFGEFLRNILLQVPVAILRMELMPGATRILDHADVTGNWIINASPLYGLPEGTITEPLQIKEYIHPEDRHLLAEKFLETVEKGLSRYTLEFRVVWPDGSIHWIDSRSIVERNAQGEVIALDGIQYDITDSKRQQERIAYMASHDALTGLPNRALCQQTLARAVAAGRRYGREFAVMYLDLDFFKEVNDALGHDAGDKLLMAISRRFKDTLRASEFVARIGGDEFLVIAEQLTIPEDIDLVAGRLIAAASAPVDIDGRPCQVSVSIGVSIFPHHSDDAETLMKYADKALYQAKEAGRNNYRVHQPEG